MTLNVKLNKLSESDIKLVCFTNIEYDYTKDYFLDIFFMKSDPISITASSFYDYVSITSFHGDILEKLQTLLDVNLISSNILPTKSEDAITEFEV